MWGSWTFFSSFFFSSSFDFLILAFGFGAPVKWDLRTENLLFLVSGIFPRKKTSKCKIFIGFNSQIYCNWTIFRLVKVKKPSRFCRYLYKVTKVSRVSINPHTFDKRENRMFQWKPLIFSVHFNYQKVGHFQPFYSIRMPSHMSAFCH